MIYKNALVPQACLPEEFVPTACYDAAINPASLAGIHVEGKTILSVEPAQNRELSNCVDLKGNMVWPGFIDAHMHLDKAHTWNRAPNRRGEFWDAIELLSDDKKHWTFEDVYRRASFSLESAWQHGASAIRTHVDTSADFGETSHKAMQELKQVWSGRIDLQTVVLCDVAEFAEPGFGKQMCDLLDSTDGDCLGGMPTMNPNIDAQLDGLFQIAADRGFDVDLHVDESGDPEARCLERIAEAVIRNKFVGKVTCGHCCSLAILDPDSQKRTLAKVADAGISVISLPLCNLYLQDRKRESCNEQNGPLTPTWRGITLVHELKSHGCTVAAASDNVRDAFYAFGDADTFEVYMTLLRIGHLDLALGNSPDYITSHAAEIMGLDNTVGKIAPGHRANLVVFSDVYHFSELLSRPASKRQRIFGDKQWERNLPSYSDL